MRSCRWALPFGDVPMHPTCADCSIGQRVNSCQLRTIPRYTLLGRAYAFCRITGKPSIIRFADDPGMIGEGYADLRDLPLEGIWIVIIRKLACHSLGSRSRSLPAI